MTDQQEKVRRLVEEMKTLDDVRLNYFYNAVRLERQRRIDQRKDNDQ